MTREKYDKRDDFHVRGETALIIVLPCSRDSRGMLISLGLLALVF